MSSGRQQRTHRHVSVARAGTSFSWKCDINAEVGAWKPIPAGRDAPVHRRDRRSSQHRPQQPARRESTIRAPTCAKATLGQLPADTLFWFLGDKAAVRHSLGLQLGIVAGKLVKDDGLARRRRHDLGRSRRRIWSNFEDLGFLRRARAVRRDAAYLTTHLDVLSSGAVSPRQSAMRSASGSASPPMGGVSGTPAAVIPLLAARGDRWRHRRR
jgi:hypothetical protein